MTGGGLQLRVPAAKADGLLGSFIEKGENLRQLGQQVAAPDETDAWSRDFDRWVKLVQEGLRSIFVGDAAAEEFKSEAGLGSYNMYDSWLERHERWMAVLAHATNALVSFRERLAFAAEAGEPPGPTPATGTGKKIFIVHGQDVASKETVARFLERVAGPGVTILAEQPDQGRTIIEKFEDYAADAGYAVILLTGDDEGRKRNSGDDLRPRARQNVILELGFFIGTLGRGHVALLYEDGVELPSDISGVLYLRLDNDGAWKARLAGELLAASVPVDAEAVLRG